MLKINKKIIAILAIVIMLMPICNIFPVYAEEKAEKNVTIIYDEYWGGNYKGMPVAILTEEGLLMELDVSLNKCTIIKDNIKKYAFGQVDGSISKMYLDNNNNLEIEIIDHNQTFKKTINNVSDISDRMYITTDGELYLLHYNSNEHIITEEDRQPNMNRLIGNKIYVGNDGTFYYIDEDIDCFVTREHTIKEVGPISEGGVEIQFIDNDNTLWKATRGGSYSYSFEKIEENSKGFPGESVIVKLDGSKAIRPDTGEIILEDVSQIAASELHDLLITKYGEVYFYSLVGMGDDENGEWREFFELNKAFIEIPKEGRVANFLSGFNANMNVGDIASLINEAMMGYYVHPAVGSEILDDDELLKTGDIIFFTNEYERKILGSDIVVIYGDVDGDGDINAFDALTLIKGINDKIEFNDDEYMEAGRILSGYGETPTALDALAIIKAVNGKTTINQDKYFKQ